MSQDNRTQDSDGYTLGPWKVDTKSGAPNGIIVTTREGWCVCTVRPCAADLSNATAIAALPDLIRAAKRLLKAMDDYDGDVPSSVDSPYQQMQNAISRAEGRK